MSNSVSQLDLTGFYRVLQLTTAECTFFSSVHGTFIKVDYNSGHKTRLNKFKRIQVLQGMFFDHKGIKSEVKTENLWKFPQIF